jgi:hypothetical protein
MAFIYSLADTWNDGATTFTGIGLNVTDTASSASSLLMDLQVGGSSKFKVAKDGVVTFKIDNLTNSPVVILGKAGSGSAAITCDTFFSIGTTNGDVSLSPAVGRASVLGGSHVAIGDASLRLYKDAASTLAQRYGTNAQTFNLYGTYTDASNYRRLVSTMSASGVAEIKPVGAGTGATGNVLHISGLPTANPGPGILWNNAGTVEVGT